MRNVLLAATALCALATLPAAAATVVGLTADNHLVRVDGDTGRASAPVAVRGAQGRLLGIDVRPKDGRLYGVTDAGQIVTLDPATGAATRVSQLNMPFESGGRAVVDFNPVADRIRLMGMSGTNFRVNPDTGEVARDGALKYAPGSDMSGTAPRITAGAYTNSTAGATATMLYTFDTMLGAFNLQAPPNDGVQQTKGTVPGLPAGVAFDILSDGAGGNMGFLMVGTALRGVNLENGALTTTRAVTGLPRSEVIDIAVMR